eukprot:TRINITY_DN3648_c0_g1_i1.p1 TRINITY_DN3648_c0_g1~~TRINITY_DN3648_c0_g1_i1.p1  ORF type:complete len:889 (+),score=152.78 TRINITY_DN3648_c0_g1_i1:104-2770(+)
MSLQMGLHDAEVFAYARGNYCTMEQATLSCTEVQMLQNLYKPEVDPSRVTAVRASLTSNAHAAWFGRHDTIPKGEPWHVFIEIICKTIESRRAIAEYEADVGACFVSYMVNGRRPPSQEKEDRDEQKQQMNSKKPDSSDADAVEPPDTIRSVLTPGSVVELCGAVAFSDQKFGDYTIFPLGADVQMFVDLQHVLVSTSADFATSDPSAWVIHVAVHEQLRKGCRILPDKHPILRKRQFLPLLDRIEANKARFFFEHHKQLSEGKLPDVSMLWALEEAVEELHEQLSLTGDGTRLQSEVVDCFRQYTKEFHADGARKPRGLLFFGPPGTGKTEVTINVQGFLGFEYVLPPNAAGSFNEQYVGLAERRLLRYFDRARRIPWMPCLLCIDEIDGMAPSRKGSSQGHTDMLGVLLSVFGGNNDAGNMFVFGSTNLRNMMDDAFLRRFLVQVYVGALSQESRRKLWQISWQRWCTSALLSDASDSAPEDVLQAYYKCSHNFTIDLASQLLATLGMRMRLCMRGKHATQLQSSDLIALIYASAADLVVRKQLYVDANHVSCYTAVRYPEIKTGPLMELLKLGVLSSGRGIMSLSQSVIELESYKSKARSLESYMSTRVLNCFNTDTCEKFPQSYGTLMMHVEQFVRTRKLHFLQQVNISVLRARGALDDQSMATTLRQMLIETTYYPSSFTVLDLDDLFHITRNESQQSAAANDSLDKPTIQNQAVRSLLKSYFVACHSPLLMSTIGFGGVDKGPYLRLPDENVAHYVLAICEDKQIWDLFREEVRWLHTAADQREKREQQDRETGFVCVNCGKGYLGKDNKDIACNFHHGSYWVRKGFELNARTNLREDALQALFKQDPDAWEKGIWTCCGMRGFHTATDHCYVGRHVPKPKQ